MFFQFIFIHCYSAGTQFRKGSFFLAKENRLPLVNDVFIINKDSIGREYIANIFEGKY